MVLHALLRGGNRSRTRIASTTADLCGSSSPYGTMTDCIYDDLVTSTEIDNHREERRLDGSRDYWMFREGGQFGSHAVFDECSDEADP
jgi:hypothetical protein